MLLQTPQRGDGRVRIRPPAVGVEQDVEVVAERLANGAQPRGVFPSRELSDFQFRSRETLLGVRLFADELVKRLAVAIITAGGVAAQPRGMDTEQMHHRHSRGFPS
jgi:hypothetical protein